MVARASLLLLILAGLGLSACAGPEPQEADPLADVSALNELRDRELQAIMAGDVEALLSWRTLDVVSMPPGAAPVRGREAVEDFFVGMFAQVRIRETATSEEVVIDGDLAYDRGTFTGTAEPLAGGEPRLLDGKYVWIARRDADGAWRYAVQMWSYNQP